jgi:hypothetical protein
MTTFARKYIAPVKVEAVAVEGDVKIEGHMEDVDAELDPRAEPKTTGAEWACVSDAWMRVYGARPKP